METKELMIGNEIDEMVQAVKRERRDMRMKGEEGEGRIHISYPSVQQYISATEMYPGIKTFTASNSDGCEDIKSHLISDAKKKSNSRLTFCLPHADK